MSKILNTQLNGVFNRIEAQDLDIQMAAQCLIQAIGGEGNVFVKGYGDLNFFENYILNSNEKLESSVALSSLNTFEDIDTTDRVFLFSPYYTENVENDVKSLIANDVDFVLICNKPKTGDFTDHLFLFVYLISYRPNVFIYVYVYSVILIYI